MKKNIFVVLLLVCTGVGAAFAQTEPASPATPPAAAVPESEARKNSLALDLFPLFKGFIATDSKNKLSYYFIDASYERLLGPHYSIGINLNYYSCNYDTVSGSYFSLSAEGRYYPQSENFEKFFLGAALGFNMMSVDGNSEPEYGGFTGLIASLKMGYKLITSKNVYMEPAMSYVLSKYTDAAPTPLGWQGGFRFGYAF